MGDGSVLPSPSPSPTPSPSVSVGSAPEREPDREAAPDGRTALERLKALLAHHERISWQALFDRIADLLLAEADGLSARELALVDGILIDLVGRVESRLRRDFAERLADFPAAPKGLIRHLARDEAAVAAPVLRRSLVLEEDDLLAVVDETGPEHRTAVAARPGLGSRTIDALLGHGETEVALALLGNDGVTLSQARLADLVGRSETEDALRAPLLSREELSPLLAHRMFWWVTSALRGRILTEFSVPPEAVDRVLNDAAAAGIAEATGRAAPSPEKERPRFGFGLGRGAPRPQVNDLVASLRAQDGQGFVKRIAQVLEIAPATARRIVEDAGGEALAVACRAMDADRAQFTTISLLLDYRRYGRARPTGHVERTAAVYDLVSTERARASVALWNAERAA